MFKRIAMLAATAALVLGSVPAWAGGSMADARVIHVPRTVSTGTSFEVVFSARRVTDWIPGSGSRQLEPTVRAVQGQRALVFAATPIAGKDRYRAAVTLPASGDWTITVGSKSCHTRVTPVMVRADDPSPRTRSS
jgi:hypothetical protein